MPDQTPGITRKSDKAGETAFLIDSLLDISGRLRRSELWPDTRRWRCYYFALGRLLTPATGYRSQLCQIASDQQSNISLPGAQLIEAKVSEDRVYRKIYNCTYFRNVHLGSMKLSARGQLLDIDESLVIEDVPPAVQKAIRRGDEGRANQKNQIGRALRP